MAVGASPCACQTRRATPGGESCRKAVALISETDALNMRAHALSSLADLPAPGRKEGSEEHGRSPRLYEAKGTLSGRQGSRDLECGRQRRSDLTLRHSLIDLRPVPRP